MDSEPIPVSFAQLEKDLYSALELDTRNQVEMTQNSEQLLKEYHMMNSGKCLPPFYILY